MAVAMSKGTTRRIQVEIPSCGHFRCRHRHLLEPCAVLFERHISTYFPRACGGECDRRANEVRLLGEKATGFNGSSKLLVFAFGAARSVGWVYWDDGRPVLMVLHYNRA